MKYPSETIENSINEIVDIFCSGGIDEILEMLKEYPNLSARVIKEFLQNKAQEAQFAKEALDFTKAILKAESDRKEQLGGSLSL